MEPVPDLRVSLARTASVDANVDHSQSMACSLWYAPCIHTISVLSSSKTATLREFSLGKLQRPAPAGGTTVSLCRTSGLVATRQSSPEHSGSASAASQLRHNPATVRHPEHVAGRCGQLFPGWAQTKMGLRQHGRDGSRSDVEESQIRRWNRA